MRLFHGVVLALTFLVAGCAQRAPDESAVPHEPQASSTTGQTPSPLTPTEPPEPGGLEAPPPVTINYFDQSVDLHAWTYCYKSGCADGSPPAHPHDVGEPEEIGVEFPLPGWSFEASFTPAGEKCGRVQEVPLETSGDGTFVLRPAGYAGSYDVTLFGRGDGDLFTTFRWTTKTDGPLPNPKARLAVLADNDGSVDSYGVEMEVKNLAEMPRSAEATITVVAANGRSLTFEAEQARGGCFPEGTLYWDRPDEKGLEAADLGTGPFTYRVDLVLDGLRYTAEASWPADEIRGNEPSVRLNFSPPLPALS